MQVRVNDTNTVKISWKHRKLREDDLASHKTLCAVEVAPPMTGDTCDFQRVQTEAKCSKKDMFSLDKGKKISLARALTKIMPGPTNKSARRVVWNEYLGVVEEPESE